MKRRAPLANTAREGLAAPTGPDEDARSNFVQKQAERPKCRMEQGP
jgi:hypothetical protein